MKRFKVFVLVIALLGAFTLILSGCGGGGGGTSSTSSTLSGTVATGSPIANATIVITDSTGKKTSTTADKNGNFSVDTTGLTPPFSLEVKLQNTVLCSYTYQNSGTANVTPITTAAFALASKGNLNCDKPPSFTSADSDKVLDTLLNSAGVNQLMQKFGLPPNFNPISTPFVANGVGMDGLLDATAWVINAVNIRPEYIVEIKDNASKNRIGGISLDSNGSPKVSDPVDLKEANNVLENWLSTPISSAQQSMHKRYFAYIKDNYPDSPNNKANGPRMVDIADDGNGNISVTITAVEGDSGDPFLIYGNGTKSGNNITFTVHVIMCSDTAENANSANANAVFTGTIGSDGTITGTFTNTLPAGDTCKENNSNTYSGTFTAYDITTATPVNMSGTYDAYATPFGGWIQVNPPTWTPTWWGEQGPVTLTITQDLQDLKKVTNVTLTVNGTSYTGTGIVYGSYVMFKIPIIICHDTNANAVAENAIFYGKFENGTITGIYGDGVPSGDYCKATNYTSSSPNTTSAIGTWRAVKK